MRLQSGVLLGYVEKFVRQVLPKRQNWFWYPGAFLYRMLSGCRIMGLCLALALILNFSAGCGTTEQDTAKIQDLDYTVLEEDAIPEEMLAEIETRKSSAFQLTYQDGEYLYIARGFGAQETGGYSILVKDLYLAQDAVCFEAVLFGPQKGEDVAYAATYPYIVVKLEYRDTDVIFL